MYPVVAQFVGHFHPSGPSGRIPAGSFGHPAAEGEEMLGRHEVAKPVGLGDELALLAPEVEVDKPGE